MIKPFDLEEAKNGAKLKTASGKDARIIAWDRKVGGRKGGNIIALVYNHKHTHEMIVQYNNKGLQVDYVSEYNLHIEE